MSKRTPNNAITEYPQYDGMYYDRCEGIQRKTHGNYRYKIINSTKKSESSICTQQKKSRNKILLFLDIISSYKLFI